MLLVHSILRSDYHQDNGLLSKLSDFYRTRTADFYALGDIDPAFAKFRDWHLWMQGDNIEYCVFMFWGLEVPVLHAIVLNEGEMRIAKEMLQVLNLPLMFEAHLSEDLETVFEPKYSFILQPHLKLVWQASFPSSSLLLAAAAEEKDREGGGEKPNNDVIVRKLTMEDGNAALELCSLLQESWFEAKELEHNEYVGVFDKQLLVSMAGTHVVSKANAVAALGNVSTREGYRRKGYARLAVKHLCGVLVKQQGIETIGLNTRKDNNAAIKLYSSLGFKIIASYNEITAISKQME